MSKRWTTSDRCPLYKAETDGLQDENFHAVYGWSVTTYTLFIVSRRGSHTLRLLEFLGVYSLCFILRSRERSQSLVLGDPGSLSHKIIHGVH